MDIDQTIYNIHVFGDSHCRLYSSPYLSNYICNVYYVGPITMHRIGRDNLTIDKLKDISKEHYKNYLPTAKPEYKHMSYPKNDVINNDDLVIYVFGEIDIRNHYFKQIEKSRNSIEILNTLVNNYINTILLNREKYNVKYGVQSVTPPVDEKNLKESLKEYPIYGDINTRIFATNEINKLLKQSCEKNNILFIDLAKYYQNDNSIYPLKNICNKSQIFELDSRIKDDNVHVHINNPEGIEYIFNLIDIPINIKYYKTNDKCKYPSSINKFQRDYYKRIRFGHNIVLGILIASLFVPDFLILIPIILWTSLLGLNYIFSGKLDSCFLNVIEFRTSNCNNRTMNDDVGIPRHLALKTIYLYIILISIIFFRIFRIFFRKKKYIN
jgi:hypothetical protein